MCSHFHDMDYLVYLKNGKIPLDQIAQMAVNKKREKKETGRRPPTLSNIFLTNASVTN